MVTTDGKVSAAEAEHRISRLQEKLEEIGADGALILQKADLFYFSGTAQDAHLYVPTEGAPLLMARKDRDRAAMESPLRTIVPLKSARQIPDILKENGYPLPGRLGMEMDVLPANLYLEYQRIFDGAVIQDVSHPIRLVRMIKSETEIQLLREAGQRADMLYSSIREYLKEGVPEVELAGLVEGHARKLGHQGMVRIRLWGSEIFYGHIMAGPSAAVPSFLASPTGGQGTCPAVAQSAGFRPIRREEPILVDYVFAFQGYIADQTRVFAIGGISDEWHRGQEAMLDIQALLRREARPGILAGDLYDMAVGRADALGYGEYFMGAGDRRIHFVGHGTGIELDEYPFIAKGQKMPLEAGMCIALEPKLIVPEKGVVGIENTHIVTQDGLVSLTAFEEDIVVI